MTSGHLAAEQELTANASALDHTQEHSHQRDHQQEVDQSGSTVHEYAQQPANDHDHGDDVKEIAHVIGFVPHRCGSCASEQCAHGVLGSTLH